MQFKNTRMLRERAHSLIPGGAHTYAKGDDQYPMLSPGFMERGHGCHVWDVDGNEYIEYGMGLRSVTLGHAYPYVVAAAMKQMRCGSNFGRPGAIEVECAEKLLSVVDGDNMVKFAKDGSTVVTAAFKLARAYTGRDMIAFCKDHPFFSYNDWFMGSTAIDSGIPASETALTATFRYNDLESLREMFAAHPGRIAGIILEPSKGDEPRDGFLQKAMDICHENGALFILDEMITGFRLNNGGGQRHYGIHADLSTWGKAMANGFALSALVGKREIMELGGIRHRDRERVFLLSTTHGAETHAMAAAIATMNVYEHEPVVAHLARQGARLKQGILQMVQTYGLEGYVNLFGPPCMLVFGTRNQFKKDSQVFRSLFMQEMIKRGVIGPSFGVSYSHANHDIDRTIDAVAGTLNIYRQALETGAEHFLVGAPTQPVYRKFNTASTETVPVPIRLPEVLPVPPVSAPHLASPREQRLAARQA